MWILCVCIAGIRCSGGSDSEMSLSSPLFVFFFIFFFSFFIFLFFLFLHFTFFIFVSNLEGPPPFSIFIFSTELWIHGLCRKMHLKYSMPRSNQGYSKEFWRIFWDGFLISLSNWGNFCHYLVQMIFSSFCNPKFRIFFFWLFLEL